jgi:hypothetical protein
MVDASHMTILQRVDDLAEHMTNQNIASEIEVFLGDHAEEVTFREVHDEEDAAALLEDAMKSNNTYRKIRCGNNDW